MAFTASTAVGQTDRSDGVKLSFLAGATDIYKGDQVLLKTDGYAYSAYATGATGDQFIGVAAENCINSAGSAGDLSVEVWVEGVFQMDIASGAIADLMGFPAYNERGASGTPRMVTVTAGSHGCVIGNIVECVDSVTACTKVRVKLTAFSTAAT